MEQALLAIAEHVSSHRQAAITGAGIAGLSKTPPSTLYATAVASSSFMYAAGVIKVRMHYTVHTCLQTGMQVCTSEPGTPSGRNYMAMISATASQSTGCSVPPAFATWNFESLQLVLA
jgi:hypothetical protein